MTDHREGSPLLRDLRAQNRQNRIESYTFTENAQCRGSNECFTNSRNRRFGLWNRPRRETTLLTVLLAVAAALLAVGLFSGRIIGESRVEGGDRDVNHQSTPPNTRIPADSHHGMSFGLEERHDLEHSNLDAFRGQAAEGNPQAVQLQPLDHREELGSERGESTMRSDLLSVSGSDPAAEGQGQNRGRAGRERGPSVKPNIFVFLIDDMGSNDIGYQSTDLSAYSPRLDALAAEGVKVRFHAWKTPNDVSFTPPLQGYRFQFKILSRAPSTVLRISIHAISFILLLPRLYPDPAQTCYRCYGVYSGMLHILFG